MECPQDSGLLNARHLCPAVTLTVSSRLSRREQQVLSRVEQARPWLAGSLTPAVCSAAWQGSNKKRAPLRRDPVAGILLQVAAFRRWRAQLQRQGCSSWQLVRWQCQIEHSSWQKPVHWPHKKTG